VGGCSADCLSVHPATVSALAAARSENRIVRVDSPFMLDFLSAQFTEAARSVLAGAVQKSRD
jgi:hypothetical protein